MKNFMPGSYILSSVSLAQEQAGKILGIETAKLAFHPDVLIVNGSQELSLGIEKMREISYILYLAPIASEHKVVIIDDFHLATREAQNAFLKTFEEPPKYAYIFLVTPYVDRLLKTIVSRAQVIYSERRKAKGEKMQLETQNSKLKALLAMNITERLLWLENEMKSMKDKTQQKRWLIETVDELVAEALELVADKAVTIEAIEYLKEAKWKIEQGFPLPKILLEGFLLQLP